MHVCKYSPAAAPVRACTRAYTRAQACGTTTPDNFELRHGAGVAGSIFRCSMGSRPTNPY